MACPLLSLGTRNKKTTRSKVSFSNLANKNAINASRTPPVRNSLSIIIVATANRTIRCLAAQLTFHKRETSCNLEAVNTSRTFLDTSSLLPVSPPRPRPGAAGTRPKSRRDFLTARLGPWRWTPPSVGKLLGRRVILLLLASLCQVSAHKQLVPVPAHI
jgi:hypothetical protein